MWRPILGPHIDIWADANHFKRVRVVDNRFNKVGPVEVLSGPVRFSYDYLYTCLSRSVRVSYGVGG